MAIAAVSSRYETLWACVVIITLIASVFYGVVALVEQWTLARLAPEQLSW